MNQFHAPNPHSLNVAKARMITESGRMISDLTAAYHHFSPNVDEARLHEIADTLREIAGSIDAALVAPCALAAE